MLNTFQFVLPEYDYTRNDPMNLENIILVNAANKKRAAKALAKELGIHPRTLTEVSMVQLMSDEEVDFVAR